MDLEKEDWTAQQMTQFYEVSRKGLAAWVKRGLPKNGRGRYPAISCFRWWKKFVIGQVDGQGTDLATERLFRERAKRKLDELKAGKEEGRLIDRSLAISWISQMIVEAKSNFWSLPRRMCGQLAAITDEKEIESLLREEIRRILTNLSQGKKKGLPQKN